MSTITPTDAAAFRAAALDPEPPVRAPSRPDLAALAPVLAGLAAGYAAGTFAKASSGYYQDPNELHGKLRATAHSSVPFLIGAIVSSDHEQLGPSSAWRAGLLGAHLVHAPLVARRLRDGGIREPQIRATLPLGAAGYVLLAVQTALLAEPLLRATGSQRTGRWRSGIDGLLLRGYTVAIAGNFTKRRRPLPVYAGLGPLLAAGYTAGRSAR